ncbi:hypothetical protein [Shewanella surugensis]|uniref:Uncharacterized protein n=1 Tax=Shewanella surugensis TaxID=212020 RepID=A0ABT0LJU9_9GAMM|nr:hypothetical protein [Shewanella surugensis]MCL1127968.1 hypothetical protein [Shewanella surugensis]
MNTERKIYSLMTVAEDQQTLSEEFIKLQQQEMIQLKQERKSLVSAHRDVLQDIQNQLGSRLHWSWIGITFLVCFFISALFVIFGYGYSQLLIKDINKYQRQSDIAEANYEALKAKNADLMTCKHNGKSYPCVRVMTSYGSYGDNRDIYILDPK